jgi:hypothetical protein
LFGDALCFENSPIGFDKLTVELFYEAQDAGYVCSTKVTHTHLLTNL